MGRLGSFTFESESDPNGVTEALINNHDHLGFIVNIVDFDTATYARDGDDKDSQYNYDPWGERRDPSDWSGAPTLRAKAKTA